MTDDPIRDETDADPPLAAMRALDREEAPDARLEDRVVNALASRGLLRRRRAIPRGGLLRALAAGVVFIIGLAFGRALPSRGANGATPPAAPRFVLLLRDGPRYEPATGDSAADRVAEYRAWSRGRFAEGRVVGGQELLDRAVALRVEPGGAIADGPGVTPRVAGLFVLEAPTYEAALAIARTCPHLRHGGEVELRPVGAS